MLLSGEINTIETRSYTLNNMFIGAVSVAVVLIIAVYGVAYSHLSSTDVNIIFIIFLGAVIIFSIRLIRRANLALRERRREDVKRVKLLKECRDEIFDRLDDHNRIVERC